MIIEKPTTEKGIGPVTTTGPDYHVFVGVDGDGCYHHYHADQDRVFVVSDDGELTVKPLYGRGLSKWLDFVEGERDWEHRLVNTITAGDIFGDLK